MKTTKCLCMMVLIAAACDIAAAGMIFVSDGEGGGVHALRKFDTATNVEMGSPYFSGGGVSVPNVRSLAVKPNGNILVSGRDGNGHFIREYTSSGTSGSLISEKRITLPTGEYAYSIAYGPDGNFYVGGNSSNIYKFDGSTGVYISTVFSSAATASGMDFGPDGKLYASMQGTGNVWQIDVTAGTGTALWDGTWAFNQGFTSPGGLVVASNGDVYAGSYGSGSIMKWNAAAGASVICTGAGIPYKHLAGMTIDESAGILYAVEHTTVKVVKYSTAGTLLGDVAQMSVPYDVAFIPEPATMVLLGLGGLALLKRKRA